VRCADAEGRAAAERKGWAPVRCAAAVSITAVACVAGIRIGQQYGVIADVEQRWLVQSLSGGWLTGPL